VNSLRALRVEPNAVSPNLIGGSLANSVITSFGATIGGGGSVASPNTVASDFGVIGGGFGNVVSGAGGSTVSGGGFNAADGASSTVGGGDSNLAGGSWSTVAGGAANSAGGSWSNVAGGDSNSADGAQANVAGGSSNLASGDDSNVAGGEANLAGGPRSNVAGGFGNVATGNAAGVAGGTFSTAGGPTSFVAGGNSNTAGGDTSFAAGHFAQALHDGTFVWADDNPFPFPSTQANEFSARATGGARFVSAINGGGAPTAGVVLAPGSGSWSSLSDRALKRNFSAVDGTWLLDRIARLPISTWSYKAQSPTIRHLGPTAQDFARAFGLGESDQRIASIDSEGVALAGVKALDRIVRRQQRLIGLQQRELARLEAEVRSLRRRR
jgi:hypothetical protein